MKRTKNCCICNKEFTPKGKGHISQLAKTCSPECAKESNKRSKRSKYSDEQIAQVIAMKKQFNTNKEIVEATGVNLNTVKKIIKENNLFLTPEQRQKNAQRKKAAIKAGEKQFVPENYVTKRKEEKEMILLRIILELTTNEEATIFNLSSQYGIDRKYISTQLKEMGIISKKQRKKQEIIEHAINMLKNNKNANINQISQETGVSYGCLKDGITKAGFDRLIPNMHSDFKDKIPLIVEELSKPDSKESVYSLSNKFDVCSGSVTKYIKKMNLSHLIRDLRTKEECSSIVGDIVEIMDKPDNKYNINYLSNKYDIKGSVVRDKLHKLGRSDLIGTGVSAPEQEVCDFVRSVLPENTVIEQSNRKILKGKEVDIYIPELKLGIEFCGIYWHSEEMGRDSQYHYNKMKDCNEQGIRLITIFSDEWEDRQKQIKNFLKSVLGVSDRRVFARKCTIKEVDKVTAREFLDNNHIQGKANLKVAIGLYFEEELLGLVTGNKHHRQGFDDIFVLNRLVFQEGVLIVGGASRLLKHLIKYTKEHGFSKMISWSDNRWSEGNVYRKCNFALTEELKPDYSYTDGEFRVSKQSCQKKNLIKKGAVGNTEKEMATSLGYSRLWDCGKLRWEIKL